MKTLFLALTAAWFFLINSEIVLAQSDAEFVAPMRPVALVNNGDFLCSGTLTKYRSRSIVITAAHCLEHVESDDEFFVREWQDQNKLGPLLKVSSFSYLSDYTPVENLIEDLTVDIPFYLAKEDLNNRIIKKLVTDKVDLFDIGIVIINQESLPLVNEQTFSYLEFLVHNKNYLMVGIDRPSGQNLLQLSIWNLKSFTISDGVTAAVGKNLSHICSGDSGGAQIAFSSDKKAEITGIASFGDCESISIFTDTKILKSTLPQLFLNLTSDE